MKDVEGLQEIVEVAPEPTIAELLKEIADLKALLYDRTVAVEPAAEQAPERNIEKVYREAEEGRSKTELERAEAWVVNEMGGRLKIQKGPAQGDGQRALEVIFDEYIVTPEIRASGKTTLPDGFRVCHSVPVVALSRYYLDIILDTESYESEQEKLLAIVENSKERNTHPGEFSFLFDAAGKLKPKNRRAARRRMKE